MTKDKSAFSLNRRQSLGLFGAAGLAAVLPGFGRGGMAAAQTAPTGQVIVADGTPEAARRLERVLTTDPGMGILRHADAGYSEALDAARRHGIPIPMQGGE